jgi:hemerythrin-like metal-binding protein
MQGVLTAHDTGPATGVLVMDVLHRQVNDALEAALAADKDDFLPRFCTLAAVMEDTFATEESWMAEIDYPAIKSHREQHARVLSGMHHVHCSLLAGDVDTARKVVACLLPDWLTLHAATLDAALAMYLQACGMPQLESPLSAGQLLTGPKLRQ